MSSSGAAVLDGSGAEMTPKGKSKLTTVCPFILGNEFCERLTYYGLVTNLVNYFTRWGASNASAASGVSAFSGFCFGFPLLGAWLADGIMGRFTVILVFSLIYVLGTLLLASTALIPGIEVEDGEKATSWQWTFLIIALLFVAIGTGGIKPNVSTFGADQFNEQDEKERKEKDSFFNWFYFSINVGALIASTVIVYIQDQDMWGIGFGIPAIALILSLTIFVLGKPLYKILPASKSPIARFFIVSFKAIQNRRKASVIVVHESWLDWAVEEDGFTENQVYEVKLAYRVFQIFCTSIFYWLVYNQMFGVMILQGEQMNRKTSIFGLDFDVPAASMSFFNTAIILIMIPVYDLLFLPSLKKLFNFTPTSLQRIGSGYIVAISAMITSFIIENRRLHLYAQENFDVVDDVEIVHLSIWWQAIPYALIGASEVLSSVGFLEFFYNQAPISMRSMMSAISLLAVGLGGWLSSLMIFIVDKCSTKTGQNWISDNLNEGHLDYFFLLLVVVMAVTFGWFLIISLFYQYKDLSLTEEQMIMVETGGRSIAYHGDDNPEALSIR